MRDVTFQAWASNAKRVSVVGDFNRWDGRVHRMVSLGASTAPRHGYRLGVSMSGGYVEIFNSDSSFYDERSINNSPAIEGEPSSWMGFPASIAVTLLPLAESILEWR